MGWRRGWAAAPFLITWVQVQLGVSGFGCPVPAPLCTEGPEPSLELMETSGKVWPPVSAVLASAKWKASLLAASKGVLPPCQCRATGGVRVWDAEKRAVSPLSCSGSQLPWQYPQPGDMGCVPAVLERTHTRSTDTAQPWLRWRSCWSSAAPSLGRDWTGFPAGTSSGISAAISGNKFFH